MFDFRKDVVSKLWAHFPLCNPRYMYDFFEKVPIVNLSNGHDGRIPCWKRRSNFKPVDISIFRWKIVDNWCGKPRQGCSFFHHLEQGRRIKGKWVWKIELLECIQRCFMDYKYFGSLGSLQESQIQKINSESFSITTVWCYTPEFFWSTKEPLIKETETTDRVIKTPTYIKEMQLFCSVQHSSCEELGNWFF